MQTFMPYPDFDKSAKSLDRQRLGKQRVEVIQLLNALLKGGGWKNHPAAKMWAGFESALARYGVEICYEWQSRGYKDSCMEKIIELAAPNSATLPAWIGNEEFHRSHQSNLIRKLPSHYQELWPGVPNDLPYVWPTEMRESFKKIPIIEWV